MSLISDSYREQLSRLHAERPDFGTSSTMYAPYVDQLIRQFKPKNFLDFGSGKQAIKPFITVPYIPYDPAIPEIANTPPPCEMVMTSTNTILTKYYAAYLEASLKFAYTYLRDAAKIQAAQMALDTYLATANLRNKPASAGGLRVRAA